MKKYGEMVFCLILQGEKKSKFGKISVKNFATSAGAKQKAVVPSQKQTIQYFPFSLHTTFKFQKATYICLKVFCFKEKKKKKEAKIGEL